MLTYQGDKIHESVTEQRLMDMCETSMMDVDNVGICLVCGEEQDGVEPDAMNYECESCGEFKVFGVEEIILMLS